MSTKTNKPWHDLPNAVHIDCILADLRARPRVWAEAWDSSRAEVGDAARHAARRAAYGAAWAAARYEAYDAAVADAARHAARHALWVESMYEAMAAGLEAILALIVWDDSAYLLSTDPEQIKVLALLGHPSAVLLHGACVALSKSSKKSMTYST